MIEGKFVDLDARAVANIIQRGGTILRTARSERFRTPEGRVKAAENLKGAGVEGLVAIGGDGTFQGRCVWNEEHGVAIVGVPGTIDNDLFGTDFTIGYDTAVNYRDGGDRQDQGHGGVARSSLLCGGHGEGCGVHRAGCRDFERGGVCGNP